MADTELNIKSDKSRLYYEAHITLGCPAVPDEWTNGIIARVCKAYDLRPSTFSLIKPEEAQPLAFISARDESFSSICNRVKLAIDALSAESLNVVRWKIEDTVLDSNRGDRLEELLAGLSK